ncbi:hypothetical protein P8452_71960 [Trifolium repens]|nr:hypothetical protein P8452_71960 [Trifolium repens]
MDLTTNPICHSHLLSRNRLSPEATSCCRFQHNLSRPLLSPSFNVPYSFVCFSASSPTRFTSITIFRFTNWGLID